MAAGLWRGAMRDRVRSGDASPGERMSRRIRLGELLLGTEGASLFRHFLDRDQTFVDRRIAAMHRILDGWEEPDLAAAVEVPELPVAEGYAAWAPSYDSMENALIRCEEPLVRAASADIEPGRALDAACGTGRHVASLAAAGHSVVGVDATPEMLEVAAAKVPTADLRVGRLESLPVDSAEFDFAICALALTHLADPTPGIIEIARAVRPGGRVVLSDAHPTFVLLQGQALFPTGAGLAFVRNHAHLHGAYLRAFAAAGLVVRECLEAPMDADFSQGLLAASEEAATALWSDIPAALVWSLEKPA